MNCKPDDLAVIVRSHDKRNIGKLVRVLRPYPGEAASWWIRGDSVLHGIYSDWPAGAEVGMYDSHLRPIRNPGEDAQDETLLWKPVPSRESETA